MEIDHVAYAAKCRRMTFDQLTYVIADCRDALKAQPMGPKAGHYCDEISYCSMELAARAKRERKQETKAVAICKHCHQPVA